ncbi:hypothetical protein GCM10011611_57910 [Aliidongia dinghuensis]|uniref:Photosynthesis system II assembly factor Ycf48/Hcf136-like domain-containing protein n=2 Tax=Aliidongia dinghuensis TaxID=1867774 RepID=A0A8J3E7L1_9PROT|nr:hypothetical protein GCM10011611_57910 [Aliidongia dinghuensis]
MLLLAATASAASLADLSGGTADPLKNPSALSPHSLHLLMTAVAWTGERLVSVGERGTILLSDDQGASWRQVRSPVRATLTAATFPAPQTGWVVGNGGVLLQTRDGGETWAKAFDGVEAAAIELAAAKAALERAPGDAAVQRRMREAEGLVADGPDKPLLDVRFLDETRGLVVGAYGLAFRTDDGGRHWRSIMGEIDNPAGHHLYGIAATPDALVLVGEQGAVFRSTDGGQSFQAEKPVGRGSLFGAVTTRSGALVAFGLRGALFRSEDGVNWARIGSRSASINAGAVLADGTVLLADETGTLARSRDDGRSFEDMRLPDPTPCFGLAAAGSDALVVAGPGGNVRVPAALVRGANAQGIAQ